MLVIKVTDKQTINDFHAVPEIIYQNDKNFIHSLKGQIEEIFNPGKNVKFKIGKARRWLFKKEHKLIGRIAAFFDSDYSVQYDQPTGCIGFFECINDKKAAFLLFETAKKWLQKNGMQAMDGPVNFGENFFFWGLLKKGFKPQTFGMQYNPEYYNELFEACGFKTYYDQFSYTLDITNPDLPPRFWKIAEWVANKPGYSFEHFTFKNQDKCIGDIIEIHKHAWSSQGNYKPVRFKELKEVIRSARLLIDEEFLWYVYHNGKPIAFFMMILDFNQIIQKLKTGKLNWWRMLKILYYKKRKLITRCRVIVLGVVPAYQGKGIESAIFYQLKKVMLRKTWYNEMEMSWVGDFNPKMNALFASFGADQSLTHATFRYLFDREKEYTRAPLIQ